MASIKTIAVIGTGRVGGALGARLGHAGYTIVYGSRSPADPRVAELVARSGPAARVAMPGDAVRAADAILFTPPWLSAEAVLRSLGDLSGKVLLDTTNHFAFKDGRDVELPVDGSAAEMIQRWAPGARVVKAFNTVNSRVMADPAKGEGPTTIPLAGDDAAAKAVAAEIVRALPPFAPFDVGPLANARYVEAMAMLYVNVILQNRPDAFEFVLRPRGK
ncbi:MAG: NAD(P)-binding domain-containing protein [Rhodospirillaceae bacterium]|nr:NAD(P)-binding domain-containing protein [Rhodospirillaceae bacterium]